METSSTVLTLALDDASFALFEDLRRKWYPPALNRIPAHVSLFHVLPADDAVRSALNDIAAKTRSFPARVSGLKGLGRGVAYGMESEALRELHRGLSTVFADLLSPQDRQGFRPHVVVQNKVTPDQARATMARLQAEPLPPNVECVGLNWWNYLGGPWELREHFPFTG